MTPEAQRIAIAETCGWTLVHWSDGELRGKLTGDPQRPIPDFPSDLNAMHEAEKTLTDENSGVFHAHLLAIQRRQFGIVTDREFQMVHAPAWERAEAFLRTLGKWTP